MKSRKDSRVAQSKVSYVYDYKPPHLKAMSGKKMEFNLEVRGRAMGMIEAGMKQKRVAEAVGILVG